MKKTKSKFADLLPRVGSTVEVVIPKHPGEVGIFEAMVIGRDAIYPYYTGEIINGNAPIMHAIIKIGFAPTGYEPELMLLDSGWRLHCTNPNLEPVIVQVSIVE